MTKRPYFAKQPARNHKCVQNHLTKCPHFASVKGGHDVTEHFEKGGCHVTCDKLSKLKPRWMTNYWTDLVSVRMSQGRIVTADGLLGGQIMWVEMSCSRFIDGWIFKALQIPKA